MAKHFEVKYFDGASVVHFDGILQPGDMSICGADLMGDSKLGWHPAKETSKKVSCPHCIMMFRFFKNVNVSEIGKEASLPTS